MSRLEEILFDRTGMCVENHCDIEEAMKLYAEECVKASLDKASENANALLVEDNTGEDVPFVLKGSINNSSNIILL